MSYEERAQCFGLANEDELKQLLSAEQDVILLDVRSESEIAESGKFEYNNRKWVQAACSPESAEELVQRMDVLLPNKNTSVIVYCKSGRRANTAKQALEENGYKFVVNAGGYDDILSMRL